MFVKQNGGGTMYYTLKDHQGNLAATIHGNTVEQLSYDAWGRHGIHLRPADASPDRHHHHKKSTAADLQLR